MAGEEYCALNIYRHSEMSISQVPRICNQLFSKQSINILGGDFNLDRNQLEFQTVVKAATKHRMLRLEGDFATHYHGKTINHLFIPNSCPKDWCFIQGASTGFQDHIIVFGGLNGKEWETTSHSKHIPEYIAKDPNFLKKVKEKLDPYQKGSDPKTFLACLKEMAWETCNEWRTGSRASFGFRRLWELQVLLRKLSALSFLPKPRTPLEVEIRREALEAGGRDDDDSPKRRRLLSVVLERIKLHIWCLENFLKIPEEATSIKLKTKVKKSGVCGVFGGG